MFRPVQSVRHKTGQLCAPVLQVTTWSQRASSSSSSSFSFNTAINPLAALLWPVPPHRSHTVIYCIMNLISPPTAWFILLVHITNVCVCVYVIVYLCVQAALAESSLSLLSSPTLITNSTGASLNMLHVGHDDVSSTVEQVNSNGSCSPGLSPQQYG